MSRDNNIKPAETKTVYDRISLGNLTISTGSAYTAGDYLHTGVLALPVFAETTDSYVRIVKIILREVVTSGTLAKGKMKLLWFTSNDMSITANSAFALADGTATTLVDLEDKATAIDTADWEEPWADSKNAIMVKYPLNPLLFKNLSTARSLYLIVLANEAITFDASAVLSGEIYVEWN